MTSAIVGATLLVAGTVAALFGAIAPSTLLQLWSRTWPVLLFVVAISVVTELASRAGLFRFIAERVLTRWGRGSALLLWLLVAALAVLSTAFLSLDTTAVLLTPVVIVLARHVRLDPVPFAILAVWLANTASLFLPVSNLTNLLAQTTLGDPSPLGFLRMMWAPAVVAAVVPTAILFVVYRRKLTGSYEAGESTPVDDRPLLIVSAAVVVALMGALVTGMPVWIPSTLAAAALTAVHWRRHGRLPAPGILPWQLVLFACGMFLVIGELEQTAAGTALRALSGAGTGAAALVRMAAIGGSGANLINNLPAYLALEHAAAGGRRLAALLVGVDAGPLILPWASLATLLWSRQLEGAGMRIPRTRMLVMGLVAAPVTVALATFALILSPAA